MDDPLQPDLYALLPAVYRIEDAKRGYPLRSLLRLVSHQATHLKQNIDALWDDFFIETCNDWVIPYIGDLVGNTPLHEAVVRRRADVAKTIYYRRRKGTLPMLEELARDVTGWGAHAVAFFEQLGWNQNLNHLRYQWAPDLLRPGPDNMDRVGTVNLRNLDAVDRLDGPFELSTHTVDVRLIQQAEGWYNIRNIGFHLWRLQSYRLTELPLFPADGVPYGYYCNTLGCPAPLFTQKESESDAAGLAGEIHVPGPVRPLALHYDLEEAREAVAAGKATASRYVGEDRSFLLKLVTAGGAEEIIPPEEIVVMDLESWKQPDALLEDNAGRSWPIRAGLDPARGRLVFADGREPEVEERVEVSCNYGFSADLGGGPYDRRETLASADTDTWRALVSRQQPDPLPVEPWFSTILDALTAWSTAVAGNPPDKAIIEVLDNGVYEEDLSLDLAGVQSLVIQATDGKRPTIRLVAAGGIGPGILSVNSGTHTTANLTLDGLLIQGGIAVYNLEDSRNSLGKLFLKHCTLVPGHELDERCMPIYPDHPSLQIEEPFTEIEVDIDQSISGWMLLAPENVKLKVRDSILDASPQTQPAGLTSVLVSANLSPFTPLTSSEPAVQITIGNEGPYRALFPAADAPYNTLAKARDGLQAAIQTAHSSPAFTNARVVSNQNRLIVLPGTARASVNIEPALTESGDEDPTAAELRLVQLPNEARQAPALLGGPLAAHYTLSTAAPRLEAWAGAGPPVEIAFDSGSPPATPVQARNQLQDALRNVDLGSAVLNAPYQNAQVELIDLTEGRALLVVPGNDEAIGFRATPSDATTLAELHLQSARPALAGSFAGDQPGPPSVLKRVTVSGPTHVRICTLASEVVFTEPLIAERRQDGCVRFSFLAFGSRAPRRYRCQPDLAYQARAKETGLDSGEDISDVERRLIYNRVRPDFTSERYGSPGYAQLSLTTAEEVRTGAEDGSEMGVFSLLKQPQREANLRIRLEEYLPFGLVPGLIFVT